MTDTLHVHAANSGEPSKENRTGLDHIGFGGASRAALDTWAAWLDEISVEHSGVNDCLAPIRYSTLVFRDPDNIQLEIFFMASYCIHRRTCGQSSLTCPHPRRMLEDRSGMFSGSHLYLAALEAL